jgi:hypothetical protein
MMQVKPPAKSTVSRIYSLAAKKETDALNGLDESISTDMKKIRITDPILNLRKVRNHRNDFMTGVVSLPKYCIG